MIVYFAKDMYKLYTVYSPTRTEQIMPFREHAFAKALLRLAASCGFTPGCLERVSDVSV